MLGKKANPTFKAKAAEALSLLPFLVELLEAHSAKVPLLCCQLLLASAKAAVRFNEILNSNGRVMPRAAQQELLDTYLRHMVFFERAGGRIVPKHHLLIHAIQRVDRLGNPRFYHTFRDESLNSVIAKIAASCHRNNFSEAVFRKWNILNELGVAYGA